MKKILIQQGDVILFGKNKREMPEGMKKVSPKNGHYIFAEGEHTGNYHGVAVCDDVEVFQDEEKNLWCTVENNPVTVIHQEHKPVTLNPGVYKIGIVREVDPFENEIRAVRD